MHDYIDRSLADAEGDSFLYRGLKAAARASAKGAATAGSTAVGAGASCPLPGAGDCSKMTGAAKAKCLAAKPATPGATPNCAAMKGAAKTKCLAAAKAGTKPATPAKPVKPATPATTSTNCAAMSGVARLRCQRANQQPPKQPPKQQPSACQQVHDWLDWALGDAEVPEDAQRTLTGRMTKAVNTVRAATRSVGKSAANAGASAVGRGGTCPVLGSRRCNLDCSKLQGIANTRCRRTTNPNLPRC